LSLTTQDGWQRKNRHKVNFAAKAFTDQSKSQPPVQTRDKGTSSVPQKTKEQCIDDGNIHLNAKEYQKALADYNRAIQLDPQHALAYNNRGNAYSSLEEYQKAIADYDRALQLDPNDTQARENREKTNRMLQRKR